jgi:hypothetical protein
MLETGMSGSMSGVWKRSTMWLVRHRQTKGSATDRPHLNRRVTPRLHSSRPLSSRVSLEVAWLQHTCFENRQGEDLPSFPANRFLACCCFDVPASD